MILSPLHIGDMYIESDKSDTIRFDKMDVNNKETITGSYYQKPITKMTLRKINYKNGVIQK
jgi:hypothetical protein